MKRRKLYGDFQNKKNFKSMSEIDEESGLSWRILKIIKWQNYLVVKNESAITIGTACIAQ